MKILYRIIFILVVVVQLIACVNRHEKSAPLTVIRVGYFLVTNPVTVYSKYADLFRKNGINAKIEYVKSSNGPALIEAFLANQVDVAAFGDQPAIMGWLRGVDVKAVANFPRKATDTWIIVADSQKIKTMQDLKGKKISVQIGTTSQHWLFLSLDQAGMKISDVKMLNVPGGDASVALMTKEIDAAVLSEPTISLLEERKIARKLKGSYCPRTNCGILLVSGDIYRNHPEVIKPIIATYWDATSWVIDNTDKVIDVIKSQITYKDLPKDVLTRQYGRNLSQVKYIGFTDSAKVGYKKIIGFLKDLKVVPQYGTLADSTEKFYDSRFVDEYYEDKAKRYNTTVAEIIKRESDRSKRTKSD